MKKDYLYLIIAVLLFLQIGNMAAQNSNDSLVYLDPSNIVRSSKHRVDSFLKIYGKEKILDVIIDFKLQDTILMLEGLWYSNSFLFKHSKAGDQIRTLTSSKMRAIYLSWLLYIDSLDWELTPKKGYRNYPIIADICNSDTLGGYADYYDLRDKGSSLNSHYKKSSGYWVDEIYNYFELWGIVLKAKGLDYLREKKMSPLNSKYKFIIRQIKEEEINK